MGDTRAVFGAISVNLIHSGEKTQTRRVMKELRVRLPRPVTSDPGWDPPFKVRSGLHTAYIGDAGAVFVTTGSGTMGLKPGEFHLVAPWVKHGTTALADVGGGRKVWTVVPYASARVLVQEVWRTHERPEDGVDGVLYAADKAFVRIQNTPEAADRWVVTRDNGKHGGNWRSPIYMPSWASRTVLEVHMARLMRLQDLTREDAIAEGVRHTDYGMHESQMSADGGVTWGVHRQPRAGWSYGPSTHHEQCLGSPQMAYANAWNRLHAGENWNLKSGPSPWDQNPWVWAYTFSRVT